MKRNKYWVSVFIKRKVYYKGYATLKCLGRNLNEAFYDYYNSYYINRPQLHNKDLKLIIQNCDNPKERTIEFI